MIHTIVLCGHGVCQQQPAPGPADSEACIRAAASMHDPRSPSTLPEPVSCISPRITTRCVRWQAKEHTELQQYAARMFGQVFASPLPPAPQLNSAEWEARAAGSSGTSAARYSLFFLHAILTSCKSLA